MELIDAILSFLLGLPTDQSPRLSDAEFSWQAPMQRWTFIFVCALLFGLVYYLYRRTERRISQGRRLTLMGLRIAVIAYVLALIQQPLMTLFVEDAIRRLLVIGIDGSSSLNIADMRTRDDRIRAAIALGKLDPHRGLAQEFRSDTEAFAALSRRALVQGVLANEDLALLSRLEDRFDLAFFTFGERLQELSEPTGEGDTAPLEAFATDSPRTYLGTSVREILNRKRGQPLAGLFLMTDGASNGGLPPESAAVQAFDEAVPLFLYGVGVTTPRDIVVSQLFLPEVSTVDDAVVANVRFRGQDLAYFPATVELLLNDRVVASQEVEFTGEAQALALEFVPRQTGEFNMEARIEPISDEASIENNSQQARIRIIDTQINVLLVERAPRWEFRYLEALLGRDRRIDLDILLTEADPSLARDENSPYITALPANREALYAYDVIILGDVGPQALGTETLNALKDWVSQFGGGLILLAGRQSNPWDYARSAVAELLPVELARDRPSGAGSFFDQPLQLAITPAGEQNPMLQLLAGGESNAAYWSELPPIYWVATVNQAKPTAEVLAVDPSLVRASRFGPMPVIALQGFGLGATLYIGTDNLWRWRSQDGGQPHVRFWSKVIQRMALTRLLTSSELSQISFQRNDYVAGERLKVLARLFRPGYLPFREARVPLTVAYTPPADSPDEQSRQWQIFLQPMPGQDGRYQQQFVATQPGTYAVSVDHDPEARIETLVTEPRFELGETAMNEALLRRMAETSGGRFFREEDLVNLPDILNADTEKVRTPVDIEIWASPLSFLLLLLLLSSEWLLRKLSGLK
ncbi:MAG: hypothetical protein ACFBZ8_11895 [Opitutales bacterium]